MQFADHFSFWCTLFLFIAPGESAIVTFTEGSGDYTITGYQQVQGDQYAALYSETVTVQLENDFLPFLYPNQYVNFTPDSKASQLALSLIDEDTVDVDALQQIYDYVVSNLTYDYEKSRYCDHRISSRCR